MDSTLALQVVAIFVILAGGLAGGLPAAISGFFADSKSPASRALRAFAAGVILALALVHIFVDAVGFLSAVIDYPLSGVCTLVGIFFMLLLEEFTHRLLHHEEDASSRPDASQKAVPPAALLVEGQENVILNQESTDRVEEVHHSFTCRSVYNKQETVRLQSLAYMFELGCIFHSIIIGVGLGILQDDESQVEALLVALTFHNMLEAISLGGFLVQARFGLWKRIFMVALFSVTIPAGTAIGIGISQLYDPNSDIANGIQGGFTAFSAGLLLYIGLIQMIAEDFNFRKKENSMSLQMQLIMYLALALGSASMCVIALWA